MDDIYSILMEEHRELVKQLDKALAGATNLKKIGDMAERHMFGEERLVYPHLKKKAETKQLYFEAIEEHKHAKMILKELLTKQINPVQKRAKIKVLKEMLQHHIKEEEKEIFPQLMNNLDNEIEAEITEKYMSLV